MRVDGWVMCYETLLIPHRKERRNGASLKDLIGTIHTNKVHLPFREPVRRNSKVKRASLGEIQGWVTSWEVLPGSVRERTKHAGKDPCWSVEPVVKSGALHDGFPKHVGSIQ